MDIKWFFNLDYPCINLGVNEIAPTALIIFLNAVKYVYSIPRYDEVVFSFIIQRQPQMIVSGGLLLQMFCLMIHITI